MDSTNPTDIQSRHNNVQHALLNVGGIHFTVLSVMILLASMTPRGALRFNPQLISDQLGQDFEEVYSPEQVRLGKARPISEKETDGYSSSIATTAPTEPDVKHEPSYDVTGLEGLATRPSSPSGSTSPISQSPPSPISGVFNSADDRERERVVRRQRSASRERPGRASTSAARERQQPVFETRVHMPTGIRVDLNVSARALPQPPSPHSSHSPHTPHAPHSPHSPVGSRTHPHF